MDEPSQRGRTRGGASSYPPRDALADAWDEHSAYVRFATALFAFGLVVGVALLLAGYNLLELVAELLGEELFAELEDEEFQLTARFLIVNNSRAFLIAIAGALTLGLLTAWIMVFNGIIVGNVAAAVADTAGLGFIVVGLVPHGIFELPALFIASAVGFRLVHRFAQRVRGTRDAFLTRAYLYRTALLLVAAWLLLALAAVIEAHLTSALLEVLFGEQLGGAGTIP